MGATSTNREEEEEEEEQDLERLTMCRGRLHDSFRERCQRMQLTRSRFSSSMRGKTQGVGGRGSGTQARSRR